MFLIPDLLHWLRDPEKCRITAVIVDTGILCSIVLCFIVIYRCCFFFFFLNRLKVCGNSVLSKSIDASSITALLLLFGCVPCGLRDISSPPGIEPWQFNPGSSTLAVKAES